MRGNLLKNDGVYELFRAFKVNKTLEKVDLGDNQFNTTEDTEENKVVVDKICEVLAAADTLLYYDFRFNNISEEGNYLGGLYLLFFHDILADNTK